MRDKLNPARAVMRALVWSFSPRRCPILEDRSQYVSIVILADGQNGYRMDVAMLRPSGSWNVVEHDVSRIDCVARETGPSLWSC
jgi:hypothetical protein